MPNETRVMAEGTLRWVQASGSGTTWATAANATGTGGNSTGVWGTMAYCRSFTHTSARQTIVVADRGVPSHHKEVGRDAPTISFQVAWGNTADYPPVRLSGSGHSVPGLFHFEYQATATEAEDAIWFQFHGSVIQSQAWTEGDPSTQDFTIQCLAMTGPTASGYLG